MWACRACGQPWPCAEARLLLKAEFAGRPPSLSIYLTGLFHEAMHDLYHLNPHHGPGPRELFDRFVVWGPTGDRPDSQGSDKPPRSAVSGDVSTAPPGPSGVGQCGVLAPGNRPTLAAPTDEVTG